MTVNVLLNAGATIGIISAVVVVIALGVMGFIFYNGKKAGNGKYIAKPKSVMEFQGDNTSLVQVIDVLAKNRDAETVVVPPTHWGIVIKDGNMQLIQGSSQELFDKSTDAQKQIHSLKLVYISKTAKIMLNWGTKPHQRLNYIEPQIGPVSIGAFGKMEICVTDPTQFYLQVVANFGDNFTTDDLRGRVMELTIDELLETLGGTIRENSISYYDFAASKNSIQSNVRVKLRDKFIGEYGFTVYNFIIEQINIPPEQEEKIRSLETYRKDRVIAKEIHEGTKEKYKEMRELAEDEDFFYDREQKRIHDKEDRERAHRHEDEDRAWAQKKIDLDRAVMAESDIAEKYFSAVKESGWENGNSKSTVLNTTIAGVGRFCRMCGTGYKPDDKYCPGCGAVIDKPNAVKKCPTCGENVAIGSNYCGKCNHKF